MPIAASRRAVGASMAVLGLGLLAYGAYLIVNSGPPVVLFDRYLYNGLLAGATFMVLARAILVERERWAWTFIGLNLLAWTLGEIFWAAWLVDDPEAPYPSIADALELLSYPFAFLGIVLLVHSRVRRFNPVTWLDASVAGLTVSAFAAAVLLPTVAESGEGSFAADATTMSYPILDTLLVAMLLGVLALVGWQANRSWLLILASLAILPVADGIFSYQEAAGTYTEGGVIDFLWPLSAILLAFTAWIPARRAQARPPAGWRSLATPALFVLAAGALVVYGYLSPFNEVAVALAGGALLVAAVRLAITYRENQRLFKRAHTDELTGLANRAALVRDLEDVLADNGKSDEQELVMLDLNGFKLYNDTFGHPAGDALLTRLGRRFHAAVQPSGRAYRIGGDEFCALLRRDNGAPLPQVPRVAASLRERGEGFEISAASGAALIPEEAAHPSDALQLADRRMYEDKSSSRSSARSQAQEVLMRALRERQPELGTHVDRVAVLAAWVAQRLGIAGEELDVVTRAAELHDIGKMAIPDAVLDKAGPLDSEEWSFIRDHTIVGERILREAPALAPVAELVRSSHERWDGMGYPDGLGGEEIPLGSRIIFVCDAYQAMRSERPYAGEVSEEDAIAELRRCAGTQFDPTVVEAFCDQTARGPSRSELQPTKAQPRV